MSLQYCEVCDKYIDTDTDAEHFDKCKNEALKEIYDKEENTLFMTGFYKALNLVEEIMNSNKDEITRYREIKELRWKKYSEIVLR